MDTTRIALIISMFVVLIIGFAIYFILRIKAYKLRQKLILTDKKFELEEIKLSNENIEKITNTDLIVEEFEFIFNSIKINDYNKNLFIENSNNAFILAKDIFKDKEIYEADINNLESYLKKENWDFIFFNYELINGNLVRESIKQLKKGGMIILKEAKNKKIENEILEFLKTKKIKYEFKKNKNSFLLIVI
ncbi:BC85_0335 family putative methyltransferase [Mesomycoplasma molare]|uniref:Methyltransferase n=1 Tax=Mesomycoplasma molare TaxID=171288 RepID=A0ABY5TTG6_9BACT|nr:hypothetical protein [Mesomycoplasma molare]UWD33962.1 hypothetical protein NX772_02535 [Mesomycoplasma molare]